MSQVKREGVETIQFHALYSKDHRTTNTPQGHSLDTANEKMLLTSATSQLVVQRKEKILRNTDSDLSCLQRRQMDQTISACRKTKAPKGALLKDRMSMVSFLENFVFIPLK